MPRAMDNYARMLARRAAALTQTGAPATPPQFASQQNWFIDAQLGNDNNSGLSFNAPLKTWSRYIALTGYEERFDGRSVDVFCRGTFPDSDPIVKRMIGTGFQQHYGIHGVLTPQLSTNLTNFTAGVPSSGGGGTRASFTVPAGLTSAMLGCLVSFPQSSVFSQVTTVSGQTATCLDPTDASNGIAPLPARVTPTNTEPVVVSRGTSARVMLEWVEASNGPPGGPGFVPQQFVFENFSVRGVATLLKHCGNDYVIDPLIQFNQFQDVDLVGDGSMFWRHNSIQVNGETTLRNRFDSTQGGYFVTGNVIMSAPGVSFPNCQLAGMEFGTYGTQGVNELSGNCNFQIEEFGAYSARLGLWTTAGGIGRLAWFSGDFGFGSGEVFGVTSQTNAIAIYDGVVITYQTNGSFHPFVIGSGGGATQLAFVKGAGANAWPVIAANGTQGAQAACTSFADVQAAPFNGRALDPSSQSAILPA